MGNFADCKFLIVCPVGCMVGYTSLFLDFMVIPVVSVSQRAPQTILHSSIQASHRSRSLGDFEFYTLQYTLTMTYCPPELIAPLFDFMACEFGL